MRFKIGIAKVGYKQKHKKKKEQQVTVFSRCDYRIDQTEHNCQKSYKAKFDHIIKVLIMRRGVHLFI
jgi:hypothetical protein